MPSSASKPSSLTAASLLAAAGALLYGMTLHAPILYDDLGHVVGNRAWSLPWSQLLPSLFSRGYFAIFFERTYQPLVTLFHYVAHDSPALLCGTGILLHALNGFLVFRLGRRLLPDGRAALWAALLFCCHPAATEAVDISSFKGHLVAVAFGLAAVEAWLAYLKNAAGRPLAAAVAFYVLALFSKETALTVGLICGLAWLLLERRRRHWPGLAALAGASAAYLAWRFLWLEPPPAFPETFSYSPFTSLAWYLRALPWPRPLCLEHSAEDGAWVWAALGAYAALLAALRRRPAELWLALWIAAALAPFLHFVAFANLSPVADRYLYLPAAGFCLLLGKAFSGRGRLALAGLCVAWGASAAARNGLYRSERALAEQTAACAPANPRAQFGLGLSCMKDRDYAEAEAAFRAALALRDSASIRTFLGESLYAQGKKSEAREQYDRARRLDPRWAERFPEAARRFRELSKFTF